MKLARKNPDITVICVEYDENKELCQALEVKVGGLLACWLGTQAGSPGSPALVLPLADPGAAGAARCALCANLVYSTLV